MTPEEIKNWLIYIPDGHKLLNICRLPHQHGLECKYEAVGTGDLKVWLAKAVREAQQEAYEEAAKIAEQTVNYKGKPVPYANQIATAIRLRSQE